jgi:hypothetical protein
MRIVRIVVEIARKLPDRTDFIVLPRRWVADRCFARVDKRLANDSEGPSPPATAFLHRCLARPS